MTGDEAKLFLHATRSVGTATAEVKLVKIAGCVEIFSLQFLHLGRDKR